MFYKNFKELRLSHGLTQAQAAKMLGVAPSTIGMYEQGRRKPDSDMLKKICTVFNTSMDYLFAVNTPLQNSERTVDDFIDEVTSTLKAQKGLMFNGSPISRKDKEKIAEAIKIATAVIVSGKKN